MTSNSWGVKQGNLLCNLVLSAFGNEVDSYDTNSLFFDPQIIRFISHFLSCFNFYEDNFTKFFSTETWKWWKKFDDCFFGVRFSPYLWWSSNEDTWHDVLFSENRQGNAWNVKLSNARLSIHITRKTWKENLLELSRKQTNSLGHTMVSSPELIPRDTLEEDVLSPLRQH